MKSLILTPESVIPWERKLPPRTLLERAIEEKQSGRTLDEMLMGARDYISSNHKEKERRRTDRETRGWVYVPPVPVVKAPADLEHLGKYIVYNGHRRRAAAKRAGIMLPCVLLNRPKDRSYLAWEDEFTDTDAMWWDEEVYYLTTVEKITEATWDAARKYHGRLK